MKFIKNKLIRRSAEMSNSQKSTILRLKNGEFDCISNTCIEFI